MNINALPDTAKSNYCLRLTLSELKALPETEDFDCSVISTAYFLQQYCTQYDLPVVELSELLTLSDKDNEALVRYAIRTNNKEYLRRLNSKGIVFSDENIIRIAYKYEDIFFELLYSNSELMNKYAAAWAIATNNKDLFMGLMPTLTDETTKLAVSVAGALGRCEYIELLGGRHRKLYLRYMIKYNQIDAFNDRCEVGYTGLDSDLLPIMAKYGRKEMVCALYKYILGGYYSEMQEAAKGNTEFLNFLEQHKELL